jgi:hypothetical protein
MEQRAEKKKEKRLGALKLAAGKEGYKLAF